MYGFKRLKRAPVIRERISTLSGPCELRHAGDRALVRQSGPPLSASDLRMQSGGCVYSTVPFVTVWKWLGDILKDKLEIDWEIIHSFFLSFSGYDSQPVSLKQSVSQSIYQSLSRRKSQSVSQSVNQSVSQSFSQSISQSVNQSVGRWAVSQSGSQSGSHQDRQLLRQSVGQSVKPIGQSMSQLLRQSISCSGDRNGVGLPKSAFRTVDSVYQASQSVNQVTQLNLLLQDKLLKES